MTMMKSLIMCTQVFHLVNKLLHFSRAGPLHLKINFFISYIEITL